MVRLPLAIVIVGVLVALATKACVLSPPGILFLTESMSMALVLENRGERESVWLLGALALKTFPSVVQESTIEKLPEVRMLLLLPAVEEPEKIQRVWVVGLFWLG